MTFKLKPLYESRTKGHLLTNECSFGLHSIEPPQTVFHASLFHMKSARGWELYKIRSLNFISALEGINHLFSVSVAFTEWHNLWDLLYCSLLCSSVRNHLLQIFWKNRRKVLSLVFSYKILVTICDRGHCSIWVPKVHIKTYYITTS